MIQYVTLGLTLVGLFIKLVILIWLVREVRIMRQFNEATLDEIIKRNQDEDMK